MRNRHVIRVVLGSFLAIWIWSGGGIAVSVACQEVAEQQPAEQQPAQIDFAKIFTIEPGWKRLGEGNPVWIDREKHRVIVGGQICLTAGMLEMFACPRGTREHESIVSVHVPARIVHAALLAVGAKPGSPVQFDPKFQAASGPKVRIDLRWMDKDKPVERRAQEMIRQVQNKQMMDQDWVFAGSVVSKDDTTGTEYYLADGGELVCVSNFGAATMDLPVSSSDVNASLLFEANPEKIPPLGTPVLMILSPEVQAAAGEKQPGANPSEPTPSKKDDSASKSGG